jgi:hypothetical protein
MMAMLDAPRVPGVESLHRRLQRKIEKLAWRETWSPRLWEFRTPTASLPAVRDADLQDLNPDSALADLAAATNQTPAFCLPNLEAFSSPSAPSVFLCDLCG